MTFTEKQKDIPLKCFLNGRPNIIPLRLAYPLFWAADFGWLWTIEWFRSHHTADSISNLITQRPKYFAQLLFTRGLLVLRQDDPALLDDHGYGPKKNNFHAYAARIGGPLFGCDYPFIHEPASVRGGTVSAYRMKSEIRWLIIEGVDENSGFSDLDIDWQQFMQKPNERLDFDDLMKTLS
jgi:hypothetical protein